MAPSGPSTALTTGHSASPSERRSRHDGGEQTPVGVEGTTVPVRPEGAPPSSLGGDAAGPGLPPHGGPSNTPGPGEGPTF